MKTLALLIPLCFTAPAFSKIQTLQLQKAVDKKIITALAYSSGVYKGYCMNLNIQNLTKDSVIIIAEAGGRLFSRNEKEQDILIVKDELMVLGKNEKKNFLIKGYCCQASHSAPSNMAKYKLPQVADSNLVTLAKYLNRQNFHQDTEQQAVWAVSNHHSVSYIPDSTEALVNLRYLVADLSGQKIPWYSIEKINYVTASGNIRCVPLFLCGTLTYTQQKENYITCKVLDKNGLPVAEIKSQWLAAGSDKKYNLRIPIKNLEQGKYLVQLSSPDKTLATKEFEI